MKNIKSKLIIFSLALFFSITTIIQAQGSSLPQGDIPIALEPGEVEFKLSDDFESEEEYVKYLKENPWVEAYINQGQPAISSSTKKVKGSLVYEISGLKSTRAIQKTYKGSTYLYVVQIYRTNDSILTRCSVSGKKATAIDYMILKDFGHTQTLEPYSFNNKTYWLTTMGYDASLDGTKWSRQLGRITYTPNKTKEFKYTSFPRINTLSGANKDGKTTGPIKRAEVALSSNKKNVLVTVQNTSNNVMYSKYDLKKLNSVFDKLAKDSNKSISATHKDVKNAATTKYFIKKWADAKWPQKSNQGVEFSDGDSIYIAGGNTSSKYPATIAKYSWSNYSMKEVIINNTSFKKGTEIEGLQLSGDYIYFGINKDNNQNIAKVFRIKKSDIG